MLDATLASWSAWWDSVPAGFGFLLALPFVVATLALMTDALSRSRRRRQEEA